MSVAIRTATRLQDQDDFGSTPGAGNDGYALVWDNGAGAFVLAAAGVTDHGALSGLSDDDHTGYALLAGRSGGQTLYGGTDANDDITIHGTSNATRTSSYVILQPTAGNVGIGTSTPTSQLHVVPTASGNITIADLSHGGSPGAGRHGIRLGRSFGSRTIEIGAYSTTADYSTPGFAVYSNSASAYMLSAVGGKLGIGDVASPTATIQGSFAATTDYTVVELLNSTGSSGAGYDLTFRVGRSAGSRYIDFGVRGDENFASQRYFIKNNDAGTSAVYNLAVLDARSSGTPAAGFGAALLWNLQSSSIANQSAGMIASSWIVATHASRTARLALSAYDYNGAREGVRIDTDGSAALLGFYGHAATGQQTLATGAGATADDIITALQALGLVKQS